MMSCARILCALAAAGIAGAAQAGVAVIPDVGTYADYGPGDATVTYDGVVFSQSAAINPTAILFNVSPGFSGVSVPVLSSQQALPGESDILITLPIAVNYVSFGFDTFDSGTVNFALSNGSSFALASGPGDYRLGSTFTTTTATPFNSILVTYTDATGRPTLNIGSVTYGGVTAVTVPEPASWALMLAGFALTGAVLRRRVALAA